MFDTRDAAGWTDLLISNRDLGRALAEKLGNNSVVLLRGHGNAVVAPNVRVAVYRANLPKEQTVARQGPPGTRDAIDEIHGLSDSAVLFAAMAVESFLNFYGVVRLGEDFYSRNYERLGILQKLAAIVATCSGELLATDDEISETLMYAMRGAARATWSTIKYIPSIEDLNKDWKTTFEREKGK